MKTSTTDAGIQSVARDADDARVEAVEGPVIGDFLAQRRVVIDLDVSSRKRLFEHMAKLLSSHKNDDDDNHDDNHDQGKPKPGPDLDTVLHTLTKREKLGCTGIGNGIALPHGRIEGLAEPRMALARLKHGIPYDAPDDVPVWLAVCLLAPVEADETHLKLLAALAECFSTPGFPEQLKQARNASELVAHFKNTSDQNPRALA